jgi:predicted regulator of Ras-like GTPase activity (Roadblock/LC7/MglB family)
MEVPLTESSLSNYANLKKTLTELNAQGSFIITVLTDNMGLPIASSSDDMDNSEIQAAVVSQVQKLIAQIRGQLEMSDSHEFILNDTKGKRLVCRSFMVDGTEMTLAILSEGANKPYKRIAAKAIRKIQNLWTIS